MSASVERDGGSYGVPCPTCGHDRSKTVDSRPDPLKTRRRRECLRCGFRYTTYEVAAKGSKTLAALMVENERLKAVLAKVSRMTANDAE